MPTKKEREIVYNKYGGRCAFCGYLLEKGWREWNIKPVETLVDENGEMTTINDITENKLPACKSCAATRQYHNGRMDIEEFRKELMLNFDFLKTGGISQSAYAKCIRYGLIKETGIAITFYFETVHISP